MIRSMTGYGRSQQSLHGRDILVEIKAVNHRYFEFSSRIPRAYGYLEEKLKSFLSSQVARGKVEVSVSITLTEGLDAQVQINQELAQSYLKALRSLAQETGLTDDLTVSRLARFSDIFTVRKVQEDEEEICSDVLAVTGQALDAFVQMREREGENLKKDVTSRLERILELVQVVEERSPQTVEEYRNRLLAKMQEVLKEVTVDPQRILTEAAIFGEKVAVAEETVRLRSHMEQLAHILDAGGAVGRKLDFMVQEMNREANTIGSKAQDITIARTVVEIKSEIEKIREQIQNIE